LVPGKGAAQARMLAIAALPLMGGLVTQPVGSMAGRRAAVLGRPHLMMVEGDAAKPLRFVSAIDPTEADSEPSSAEATVMPLFPLGATYLPYTNPVLNIFEPRYRKMFNDILFSGARRFMVTNVEPETGRLAEVGVIFYLDELKEVSEQTQDRVKYIGQHSVVGRVKLLNVLNPSVAATRESYLRAEVEVLGEEEGEDADEAESSTERLFLEIVDAQAKLGEEPRFTQAVKNGLSFKVGSGTDDKGLWGTIVLWQQFLEQRTAVMGQKMQREIQKGVVEFLKDNEIQEGVVNSRGEIRLEDLPAPLLQEIKSIQARYREELDTMESDPYGLQFQALLQADSHAERLVIFGDILGKESRRLTARLTLQSMFKT